MAAPPTSLNRPLAPPPDAMWRRRLQRLLRSKLFWVFAIPALLVVAVFLGFASYFSRLIDERLSGSAFQGSSIVYAAPRLIAVGDPVSADDITQQLQRSGYSLTPSNPMGWYQRTADTLEIQNGPESYFQPYKLRLRFAGGKVAEISSDRAAQPSGECLLEPELISNLFGTDREKRRIVQFQDIPRILIQAVTSVEDRHFFEHSGFDLGRILKSGYVDLKAGRKEQGASTLTMQTARMFWLDQQKTWKRKLSEAMITFEIEWKLPKEKIFEYYANEVYLGQRGSFSIHGFGQAARSYFNKDLRDLTVPEAAMLAGIIQRPSFFNPFRYPDRARTRRNIVLQLMHDNGYIDDPTYVRSIETPIVVNSANENSSTEAPYFVDMVNQEVQDVLNEKDLANNSYRIYSSLDSNLQREAINAVKIGMAEVDDQVKRQKRPKDSALPQVAMVVLDSQSGAIKALIGGRNYGQSQLNHALSLRQPGSVFKPFVYAAAFNLSALHKGKVIVTPSTILPDEPITFRYGKQTYAPNDYHHEAYMGNVTARTALAKSLNIPTVRLAEMIGYKNVVDLAKEAGMNEDIQATPAVALGAYEVTPVEIAGAYTIFSRKGVLTDTSLIGMIRNRSGHVVYSRKQEDKPVLDPRAAFLTVDLMQEVLRSGTAASVWSRGFRLPAAGKTGTSHDGWFAGFTSKLLCVVWVGYDDNRELDLEGAKSALPIWTEFMKRAHQYHEYKDVQQFTPPSGITRLQVCNESGQLATQFCPSTRWDAFIQGEAPSTPCELHEFGGDSGPSPTEANQYPGGEHKGVIGKILGVFK